MTKSKVTRINKLKIGLINLQHHKNGTITETEYHPKKKNKNNQIKCEGKTFDGKKIGLWKHYTHIGVVIAEKRYKDGEYDGRQIEYYHSGKLKIIRYYENGIPIGVWQFYEEDGFLFQELVHKDGGVEWFQHERPKYKPKKWNFGSD